MQGKQQWKEQGSCPHGIYFLVGEVGSKQVNIYSNSRERYEEK